MATETDTLVEGSGHSRPCHFISWGGTPGFLSVVECFGPEPVCTGRRGEKLF